MIGKYVIKTRKTEDEYLSYSSVTEEFDLTDNIQYADKYQTLEEARKYVNVSVLEDSPHKNDIYKIVMSTEYVERGL